MEFPCAWMACQLVLTGAKHRHLETELDLKMYTCSLTCMQSCKNTHRCHLLLHTAPQLLLSGWCHQPGSSPQLGVLAVRAIPAWQGRYSTAPYQAFIGLEMQNAFPLLPGVSEWFVFWFKAQIPFPRGHSDELLWCWSFVKLTFKMLELGFCLGQLGLQL